jgi:hypothetical protein
VGHSLAAGLGGCKTTTACEIRGEQPAINLAGEKSAINLAFLERELDGNGGSDIVRGGTNLQ